MKQRFSALDIAAIAAELREQVVGCRLNNFYDLNARTFLLKFGKQVCVESNKYFFTNPLKDAKYSIVIESGFRAHLTKFDRENAPLSGFVTKLRKHIKSRRLTGVSQLGTDRVLVFTFGGGANDQDPDWTYYLVCEFFAAGNVLLLDGHYKILSLLRVVTFDKDQVYAVGQKYNLDKNNLVNDNKSQSTIPHMTAERLNILLDEISTAYASPTSINEPLPDQQLSSSTKPIKVPKPVSLRKALTIRLGESGNALIEHCLRRSKLDPLFPASQLCADETKKNDLLAAFQEADSILAAVNKPPVKGYIFSLEQALTNAADPQHPEESTTLYEDFHPFQPLQLVQANRKCMEFPTYNECVDEFFSSIEAQKLKKRAHDRLATAERRLESAKEDQARKLQSLQDAQATCALRAQAIEMNPELVEAIISYINSLLNQGMDWLDIEKLIQSQKRRSPVAAAIQIPLKLIKNAVTVFLPNPESVDNSDESSETSDDDLDDSDDDNKVKEGKVSSKFIAVELDLSLGAFANARKQYELRREALIKETKTAEAASKALKSTQRKIEQDLKRSTTADTQRILLGRKTFFFEKFHWFISSEGYLVLGGRDAQQNELLFQKYCNTGDIFVCADLPKSSIIIVKNKNPHDPIPPNTLQQAGSLALASSKAWDSKTVISAWWVRIDEVSKLAPTGEILPTGSFAIRAKKNYLPPTVLIMGYGILWQLDEKSSERRKARRLEMEVVETQGKVSELKMEGTSVTSEDNIQDVVSEVSYNEDTNNQSTPDTTGSDIHIVSEKRGKKGSKVITAKKVSAKERREARRARRQTALEESLKAPISIEDATDPQTILAILKQKKAKKKHAAREMEISSQIPSNDSSNVQTPTAESEIEEDGVSEPISAEVIEDQSRNSEAENEKGLSTEQRDEKKHAKVESFQRQEMPRSLFEEIFFAIDSLTPNPQQQDTVINAVPTFAPYNAMTKFNQKVKVMPGTGKVGKAARESIAYFMKKLPKSSKEAAYLENLKDGEIVAPISVSRLKMVFGSSGNTKKSKK